MAEASAPAHVRAIRLWLVAMAALIEPAVLVAA